MHTSRGILAVLLVLPLLVACGGSSDNSEQPPEDLSVTSVSPDRGSMSGDYRAQVRGSGFSAGVTLLTFGGVAAAEVSASGDTTLDCTVPGSRESGPVDVAVTTSAGTATLEQGFTYNDPPRVFFLAPPAEEDRDSLTHAVIVDREAMNAEGYVNSDDTGRIWERMGTWPLVEETR